METTRRSFLKSGALGTLLAPILGPTAMEQAGASVLTDHVPELPHDYHSRPWENGWTAKMLRALKGGLPKHRLEDVKSTARTNARVLDPDLASMRSVSLSRKIDIQYERNITRYIKAEYKHYELELERAVWNNKHKLDTPGS